MKDPRKQVEKRDVMIARDHQRGGNGETIDERSCGAKLRPARALRYVTG
jgi:hypothetical protein